MFNGTCFIRRAGVTANGVAQLDMMAADGSWAWSWFLGQPALTREFLAIALAAITSDRQVQVEIDDPTVPWSLVKSFFLVK